MQLHTPRELLQGPMFVGPFYVKISKPVQSVESVLPVIEAVKRGCKRPLSLPPLGLEESMLKQVLRFRSQTSIDGR